MLDAMAMVGAESIVSWQPHGTAFRVHQPEVFARTVMPHYFKQIQYNSFMRQLHIYGFQRIGKGIDIGAYVHPMFIRDKKYMSLRMPRQGIQQCRRKSSNAHLIIMLPLTHTFLQRLMRTMIKTSRIDATSRMCSKLIRYYDRHACTPLSRRRSGVVANTIQQQQHLLLAAIITNPTRTSRLSTGLFF
jgi:hypothetical protein